MGCSPWGRKELDPTEQLSMHFTQSLRKRHSAGPASKVSSGSVPESGLKVWPRPSTETHDKAAPDPGLLFAERKALLALPTPLSQLVRPFHNDLSPDSFLKLELTFYASLHAQRQ